MKKEVEGVDVMCFVTPLDDLRVSSDEQRAIRSLSEAFGYEIWQYSVIIFTFSNKVEPEEFEEAFNKRRQSIVDVIKKYTGENIADKIPAVAIDNRHETNPDGQKWLGELFTRIFTRMSNTGLKSFFLAMLKDLKKSPPLQIQSSWNHSAEKKDSERIELNKRQKAEIRKTIDAKIIPGLAAAGAGIGATFGPVGAAVGGLIGGAIGFIAWLWD